MIQKFYYRTNNTRTIYFIKFSNSLTGFWTFANCSSGITLINAQRTIYRNNRQAIPQ